MPVSRFRLVIDAVSALPRSAETEIGSNTPGDYDFICNWIGNKKWTESFEWTGKKAFVQQQLRPWMVNGKQAGITRAAKGLTYATVHGAGHMVGTACHSESYRLN